MTTDHFFFADLANRRRWALQAQAEPARAVRPNRPADRGRSLLRAILTVVRSTEGSSS